LKLVALNVGPTTKQKGPWPAVVQHPLLNYSFYISRMPVITTDPRSKITWANF